MEIDIRIETFLEEIHWSVKSYNTIDVIVSGGNDSSVPLDGGDHRFPRVLDFNIDFSSEFIASLVSQMDAKVIKSGINAIEVSVAEARQVDGLFGINGFVVNHELQLKQSEGRVLAPIPVRSDHNHMHSMSQ